MATPMNDKSVPIASNTSFSEGLNLSRQGKVLVVVLTSPGDRINPEVWAAPEVKEWLDSYGTLLKYQPGMMNGEQESVQALIDREPGVVAFTNGELVDRDESFATPAQAMQWLRTLKPGPMTVEYARSRAGERTDTSRSATRIMFADRLDRLGLKDEADDEYAWAIERWLSTPAFDPAKGGDPSESMRGPNMKVGAYRRGVGHLKKDADAQSRLIRSRDAAATLVEVDPNNEFALIRWQQMLVVVPDTDRVLAWFGRMRREEKYKKVASENWQWINGLLISEGRWADAGRIIDNPSGKLSALIRRVDMVEVSGAPNKEAGAPGPLLGLPGEREAVVEGSIMYGTLLAAGREQEAGVIADTLIERFQSPKVQRALVKGALKAKSVRPVHLDWADIAAREPQPGDNLRAEVQAALDAVKLK